MLRNEYSVEKSASIHPRRSLLEFLKIRASYTAVSGSFYEASLAHPMGVGKFSTSSCPELVERRPLMRAIQVRSTVVRPAFSLSFMLDSPDLASQVDIRVS